MENVKCVSIDSEYCAAVKNDGSLWTWGGEEDGKTTALSIPSKKLENVKTAQIVRDYGQWEIFMIKDDGAYWFWEEGKAPIKVADDARYVETEQGVYVAQSDGTLKCWKRYDAKNNSELVPVVFPDKINKETQDDGSSNTTIVRHDEAGNEITEYTSLNADGSAYESIVCKYLNGKILFTERFKANNQSLINEYRLNDEGRNLLITYSSEKTTIAVPSSVTVDGKKYTITRIGDLAFEYCPNVTKIKVGKNIESIADSAFDELPKLKVIVINAKNLKEIEDDAFYGLGKGVQIKIKAGKKRYKEVLEMIQKSGVSSEVKISRSK